jgi:hypothetical protein
MHRRVELFAVACAVTAATFCAPGTSGATSNPRRAAAPPSPAVQHRGLFTLGPTWDLPSDPPRSERPGQPIVGNFTSDGHSDVLWYAAGANGSEFFDGGPAGVLTGFGITIYGSYEPVVGDFNGDGASDILWIADTTADRTNIWLGGGTPGAPFHAGPSVPALPPPYVSDGSEAFNQPVTGDFNGDGRTDIYWVASNPNPSYLWLGKANGDFVAGSKSTARTTDFRHTLPILGDFNGDGKTDALWYQPGFTELWLGSTNGFVRGSAPTVHGNDDVRAVDFNGDGTSDLLWYAPGPGDDMTWTGSPSGFTDIVHEPLVSGTYFLIDGDFTGDSHTDIQWIFDERVAHAGSAPSWVGSTAGFRNGPAISSYPPTSTPIVADFDNDGHADIAWINYPTRDGHRTITIWYGD